jgi:hypothetical protein
MRSGSAILLVGWVVLPVLHEIIKEGKGGKVEGGEGRGGRGGREEGGERGGREGGGERESQIRL